MAINHQSPGYSLPSFRMKQLNTTTWGSNSNTLTVTDTYIFPNSVVIAFPTGTVPAAGNWSYAVTQGQVVITSSDSESSTLAITYIVL
jgi:hypothetical protein